MKEAKPNVFPKLKKKSSHGLLMYSALYSYYATDAKKMNILIGIVSESTRLSLRLIDWFVTSYARRNNTVYNLNGERFHVYNVYQQMLTGYTKYFFDPFCRWERSYLPYEEGKTVETTVAQLHFFKWAIDSQLLTYIESNYADIESDMKKCAAEITHQKEQQRLLSLSSSSFSSSSSPSLSSGGDTLSLLPSLPRTRKRQDFSMSRTIKREYVSLTINLNK